MARRRRAVAVREGAPAAAAGLPSWAVFSAAFLIRLLYWRATADAEWPHTAAFKGDALLWLEYARALRAGLPFELGLPIHPPGAGYLVAALWDGHGFALLKVAWCALGAVAAALFAAAIARAFGPRPGALAGVVLAGASGLLMLSTSLNGETPYLALVAAGFRLLPGTDPAPSRSRVAAWAVLQGLACLFRVEHVLFAAAAALWMAARALRVSAREAVAIGLVAAGAFAVPLLPWHWTAWRSIARFNAEPPPTPPPVRGLLDALAGQVAWDPDARAQLLALPAFARDHAEAFVAATIAHRGGRRVRAADLDLLAEAFGTPPRPLAAHPFVSIYGPLNFALASHPRAPAGFNHEALDERPPMLANPSAFPPFLLAGLPPRDLSFTYPPHVALVNDGYRMGARWLAAAPGAAARRAAERLRRFWAGAATGLTGCGLPAGVSGVRYAVDITVADGWMATAWRVLLLAACVAGIAAGWRWPALYPWLLFLVSRAVPAVLFFGYARLGATAIPVIALMVALASTRWIRGDALTPARLRLALAALVVIEAVRFVSGPSLTLDGSAAGPRDPVAVGDSMDHRLAVGR